jgi:hypothetical protein
MPYHNIGGDLTITYTKAFFDSIDLKVFSDFFISQNINVLKKEDIAEPYDASWLLRTLKAPNGDYGYDINDVYQTRDQLLKIIFDFYGDYEPWIKVRLDFLARLGFGIEANFREKDYQGRIFHKEYIEGDQSLSVAKRFITLPKEEFDTVASKAKKYDSIGKTLENDPTRSWTRKELIAYLELDSLANKD